MLARLERMEQKLDEILVTLHRPSSPLPETSNTAARKRMRVVSSDNEDSGDDCDDNSTDADSDSEGIDPISQCFV